MTTLVTLLGDVATNYVQVRTFQKRIAYAQANVQLQQETRNDCRGPLPRRHDQRARSLSGPQHAGANRGPNPRVGDLPRQAGNQLCILLGMPPEEPCARAGPGPIPMVPAEVVVGIPGRLLAGVPSPSRPSGKRPPRAQIGVAEANFYPAVSINGPSAIRPSTFPTLSVPGTHTEGSAPRSSGTS